MFKDIPDMDGAYSCDESGRIKSNRRLVYNNGSGHYYFIQERVLKPYQNNKGYWYVDLRIQNKTVRWLVHRLVALTWIPNPDGLPVINHIDNNPSNNSVNNLEWCTTQYNVNYCIKQGRMNYHTNARIRAQKSPKTFLYKPVNQYSLEGEYLNSYASITVAAKSIKTSNSRSRVSNISACCSGKAKSAYGFIWRYKSNENVTTNFECTSS